MSRPLHVWLSFGMALAVLVAAVGWISWTALKLERSEGEARRRAELEENVRLALWRLDSTVAPLVSQESARPYFVYSAFYPAMGTYTRMFSAMQPNQVVVASPLLVEEVPFVRLHFQLDDKGQLSSPEVPKDNPTLPPTLRLDTPRLKRSRELLGELTRTVRAAELRAAFPPGSDVPETRPSLGPDLAQGSHVGLSQGQAGQVFQQDATPDELAQNFTVQNAMVKSSQEWRARAANSYQQRSSKRSYASDTLPPAEVNCAEPAMRAAAQPSTVAEGPVRPIWMGGQLLLARGVSLAGRPYVQGCWVDWDALKKELTDGVKDLFPRAALEPILHVTPVDVTPADHARALASIPVLLVPGVAAPAPLPVGMQSLTESPLGLSLVAAWASVGMAALAVAALLLGVLSLSERRATFVSAVTHELRTPLTTFRLYTDLLEGDLVKDPDKRKSYLVTLKREAERLGHLVENVLAYARLERGVSGRRLEPVKLADLIARCRPRLDERAQAAGLALEIDLPEEAARAEIHTDAAAVEQVLFNLVDNAGKYAAGGDRRVQVSVRHGHATTLTVRDHGPGISRREARKLFVPFSRSSEQAAGSAPGVGLGLALSRQLARQLGGDLTLDTSVTPGAQFTVTLPGR